MWFVSRLLVTASGCWCRGGAAAAGLRGAGIGAGVPFARLGAAAAGLGAAAAGLGAEAGLGAAAAGLGAAC